MENVTDKRLETIEDLIGMVLAENKRQVEKHGVVSKSPYEWLAYLTEEVGEVSDALQSVEYRNGDWKKVREEAIQVATLALKIAEMSSQLGSVT